MASAEFQFDTRIRRYHVPLRTQQHRMRHLRSIAARNIVFDCDKDVSNIGLYYTLHHELGSEAFYRSEIICDTVNPTWKDIEPTFFPANAILSSPYMTVKMWNSFDKLLVEWFIFFTGLTFLGRQISKDGNSFKPNSLIFGMVEGYYGCSHEMMQGKISQYSMKDCFQSDISIVRTSCAFSTLGRMKTFERVISQIQATASKWKQSIEIKLHEAQKLHQLHLSHEMLKIKTAMLQVEVYQQKCSLMSLEKVGLSDFTEINIDHTELKNVYTELKSKKDKLALIFLNFWELKENLLKAEAQLNFRRKELISDLCSIYPVIQFPDQKGYSINNIHLPNSEKLYGHDEIMISVALGYVCHVLLMISQFLNVPLRYDIHFNGSKSNIADHISVAMPVKNRIFPLYSKGKDKTFFEYAVYLLNKNIAQFRILFGLTCKELSDTLPNLHDLIEQRFSLQSETNYLHLTKNAFASPDDSNRETLTINGVSHTGNASINLTLRNGTNSDIELIKKEVAKMIPTDSDKLLPSGTSFLWTKDITNVFSGSLDKGLNNIKVLEMDQDVHTKVQRVKQLIDSSHHSSYPNLNSQIQTDAIPSDLDITDLSIASSSLKTWIVGDSHTNSEDEMIEENSEFELCSESPSDFHSNISASWIEDATKGDSSLSTHNILLEKHNFEEDLTFRAEQLAKRTSSFQMQKLNAICDEPKINPS